MPEQTCICGVGMMTPVGDCTAQTVSSVRAGISRYCQSEIYNKRSAAMTLALLPDDALPPLNPALTDIADITPRQIRMLRLAAPALHEAMQVVPKDVKVSLFLAVPEALPEQPPPVSQLFVDYLIAQTGLPIDRATSRLSPSGRAGGLYAIAAAQQLLLQQPKAFVLIGGVDSHFDLDLLARLDLNDRVLADGAMDSFAPGEGAGFLLLCTEQQRAAAGLKALAWLHPPGTAIEPGHRYSEQAYLGDGLTDALRLALVQCDTAPIHNVLSSLNGEGFGAKEWGVAVLRNRNRLADNFELQHPAEYFGDAGAATGPLLLGLAAIGLNKGYLQSPTLVWCASEWQHRAAVCVSVQP